MARQPWVFTQSDGELLLRTEVTGRAKRFGHRLTIRMATWQATVRWRGHEPAAVEAAIELAGLEIVSGAGGMKPLSTPEKAIARGNALGSLAADAYPVVAYTCEAPVPTATGYDLAGELEIHGTTRPHRLAVAVQEDQDRWLLTFESSVRQSDFGVKPYSLMMGSLAVGDEVAVSFRAARARP